jgi:hypothetical protein
MPELFDKCVAGGGKVITKRLSKEHYIHVCYPKGGGPSISGEEKTYKKVLKGKNK